MEVSKVPPSDVSSMRSGTAAAGQGSGMAATIAPTADRADIRPLDIAGALQILLAEVRAGLDLPLESSIAQAPDQAACQIVALLVHALPEDAGNAPAWTAALVRVEAAIQSGFDRALTVVTQWRDVTPAVADSVEETRTQFFSALEGESPNPLWVRPEWMGLVPALNRFRRRRRNARRRLSDPDHSPASLDDSEDFRR
jgi:hypothetical protein